MFRTTGGGDAYLAACWGQIRSTGGSVGGITIDWSTMLAMNAVTITRLTLFLAFFDGEQKFAVTENASISGIDIRRGIERIEDVGGTNQQLGSDSKHGS